MSTLQQVDQFVERLQGAADLDAIYGAIETHVRSLGFERFTYHVVRPPEGPRKRFFLSNYPDVWVDHYIEREYVNIDPIAPLAASTTLPFAWPELRQGRRKNPKWEQFFNEAGDFGLENGFTVPAHGPGQCLATFNFVAEVPSREFDMLVGCHRHNLHLTAIYGHQAVIDHAMAMQGEESIHLSPRERECLLWSSRGKTVWEISEILSLSKDTVTEYLKSAARKLGVYSKTHAVVKAVILGIIVP